MVFGLTVAALANTGRTQLLIDSLRIDGAQVTALEADGDSLWTYTAPGRINTADLGDMDGDTYPEVVVGTGYETFGLVIEVRNNGTQFWQFQTGTTGVFWPDSQYNVVQLDISDADGDGRREVISVSNHNMWFPSRVCVLSDSGSLRGDYWNPGHGGWTEWSMVEFDLNSDGVKEIVIDCLNNDLGFIRCAYLLEGNNVHGQAPPYFGNAAHGTERWYYTGHNGTVSEFEAINDLDGDGWQDLRVHYFDGQQILLSGNTGMLIQRLAQPPFVDCFDDSANADWTPWGEPPPQWLARVHDRQGISDNNGDPTNSSGAISNVVFDVSHGFVVQSDVFLDRWDLQGCWVEAALGISKTQPEFWGGYDSYIRLGFELIGDACFTVPAEYRRHAYVHCSYVGESGAVEFGQPGQGELFVADSLLNSWQTLKIVVDSVTHLPRFYIGNNLVFSGSVAVADSVLATPRPLWMGASSSGFGGKAYHDLIGFNVEFPPAILEVVGPGVGDEWRIGQIGAGVEWTYANLTGTVTVDLYRNGSFVQQIGGGLNVTARTAAWTVPATMPEGDDYQIFIRSEVDTAVHHLGPEFRILISTVPRGDFFDAFGVGTFDAWNLWGNPLPAWVAGAQGRTGLFDNNGDAAYTSGAVSRERLDFSGGFVMESDILLDFYDPTGCWADALLGIADTVLDVNWGGYNSLLEFGLNCVGDACWSVPEPYRRHTYFQGRYWTDQGWEYVGGPEWSDQINADPYANSWHTLKIMMDSTTRVPGFFIDGSPVYAGTRPLSGSVIDSPHSLCIKGNSSGSAGKAYHDYIRLNSLRSGTERPPGNGAVQALLLEQNYPNPFNQSTMIRFELTSPAKVRLSVVNMLGQEVAVLVHGVLPGGVHQAVWDGLTQAGVPAGSGLYVCSLRAGTFHAFRKMLLVR